MKLVELSSVDKDHYNAFVAAQESGSFLQSWEWGQWQERLGKKAFRFFIDDDGGNTVASIQLIQSPLPLGRFYLYAPYGPVVSEKLKVESKKLVQELQKRFPSAIFIRIEPKVTFHFPLSTFHLPIYKSVNIQPGKTLVVDLKKTEDELLAEMHPKTRYNIKLAQRHGVQISGELIAVPGHGLYVKEALDLIINTADRQSFQTFPFSYYDGLLNFFAVQNPDSAVRLYIYKALLERELLSTAIMVDFGLTRTYLFGGSSQHHREVMAPYALHFTAMRDAKNLGLSSYDFWGIETASGDMPGFVRFKMGFAPQSDSGLAGGSIKEYAGAYDIPRQKLWYHGYKALRQVNRTWIFVKSLPRKLK